MRRYQKWFSVGLMALTPSLALAGPLNSPQLQLRPATGRSAAGRPRRRREPRIRRLANKIAAALKKAKLSGFEIDISVQNGVATLDGMVGSPEQRAAAHKAACRFPASASQ